MKRGIKTKADLEKEIQTLERALLLCYNYFMENHFFSAQDYETAQFPWTWIEQHFGIKTTYIDRTKRETREGPSVREM